jgi:hypothetical protein
VPKEEVVVEATVPNNSSRLGLNAGIGILGKAASTMLLVGLLISLIFLQGHAQLREEHAQVTQVYDEVLQIAMPKQISGSDIESALTIRVQPSFDAEFQFVFFKKKGRGSVQVIKKQATKNIFYQIVDLEMATDQRVLATDAARKIQIVETQTDIPLAKFNELITALTAASRAHEENETRQRKSSLGTDTAVSDGTECVIWLADADQQIDVTFRSIGNLSAPHTINDIPVLTIIKNLQAEKFR